MTGISIDNVAIHNILIREADLTELSILKEFEQGIVKAERPFDPTLADDPISYYDLAEMIQSDSAAVFVAEVETKLANKQIVASGYVKIIDSKPYQKFSQHAYLGFMFVEPDFRGKKINQLIVDALINWSKEKGITEIELEVYAENEPAIRAYEKAGFSKNIIRMRKPI